MLEDVVDTDDRSKFLLLYAICSDEAMEFVFNSEEALDWSHCW